MALTSTHSEYYDYLICTGIAGVAVYLTLLGAFLWYFISSDLKTDWQKTAALCVVSYAVYTMFMFSTICATPMFFILLGITQCGDRQRESAS